MRRSHNHKRDFFKPEWWRPVEKTPQLREIWKISAETGAGRLSRTRPVLLYDMVKVAGKKWFFAFPVCGDAEMAGAGDPFFLGQKQGLGYEFFVELFNPVYIPEDRLIRRIGMLDQNDIKEVERFLKNQMWKREKSRTVLNFRKKEIELMDAYNALVPFKVRAVFFLKRLERGIIVTRSSQLPVKGYSSIGITLSFSELARILMSFTYALRKVKKTQLTFTPDPLLKLFISPPSFRSTSLLEDDEKELSLYFRHLAKTLEELKEEEKELVDTVNETLLYIYITLGWKKKAKALLREVKLSPGAQSAIEKQMEEPEKYADKLARKVKRLLEKLRRKLESE